MRTKQVIARTTALWGLIAATTSVAVLAAKPPVAEDSVTNPAAVTPGKKAVSVARPTVSGDEGTIAGPGVVLWDNGPMLTSVGDSGCPSAPDKSLLQNTAQCLNVLGFGVVSTVSIADNFTLTGPAHIDRVTVYAYLTGSTTTPTITGASATLHSGRPYTPGSNVIAGPTTLLVGPATFANPKVSRMSESAPGCTRRIQQVQIDTAAWPNLPAGNYWISFNVTGASFCPPVTLLGAYQKPGANAMQLSGTNFVGLYDTGATPANCPTYPTDNPLTPGVAAAAQDMPFILEGTLLPGCPADINHDNTVGVADLLAVINAWGATGPNPADVNGDNSVGVADLLAVIGAWGNCPPQPPQPPAPATGACTVGVVCASPVTFDQCFNQGGSYGGDGSVCLGACCTAGSCSLTAPANCTGTFAGVGTTCPAGTCPPANDNCSNATTITLNSPLSTNNLFATTDGPAADVTCTSLANNVTRDVWYSFATTNGVTYTATTVGTTPTNLDTSIQIYDNCAFTTQIACNDDAATPAGTLLSTATWVGNGSVVLIRVGSWQAGGVGNIQLTITSP